MLLLALVASPPIEQIARVAWSRRTDISAIDGCAKTDTSASTRHQFTSQTGGLHRLAGRVPSARLLSCFFGEGSAARSMRSATWRGFAIVTANLLTVLLLRHGACWLSRRTASCWRCFYVLNDLGCRAGLPPVRRDGCRTNA